MRAILLEQLYEWSKIPYQRYLKKQSPWTITKLDLEHYPLNSLGYHLYCFLSQHSFEMQENLESHDVFHVLTGTGTSVSEEISMQYYLLGNGKRSPYLFMAIIIGTALYLDHIQQFCTAFSRGKSAWRFHHLDFSKLLQLPLRRIQHIFLIH